MANPPPTPEKGTQSGAPTSPTSSMWPEGGEAKSVRDTYDQPAKGGRDMGEPND
jgi:hypothetical protein